MSKLKELISVGVGISQEFVPSIDNNIALAQMIVSFANTQGGKVLVGVKGNGKIVGVFPQEELQSIKEIVEEFCEPTVSIESIVHQEGRHLVLEVQIPKSNGKHKAKDEKGHFQFYHRIENQTFLASRIAIQLWKFQNKESLKPEFFNKETAELIDLIKDNQPVTISKLYRLSSSDMNKVNELVASLIHWNIVGCVVLDSNVCYVIHG